MEPFNSGELRKIFRINSHKLFIGLTIDGKACLAAGGVKRWFQYCTDASGTIVYFRSLQGHSGRNLIDPSLQDNVVIQGGFFQHIYHIGCAFNLHSIINSGLIPGGHNSSKRQTVFFLPVDPMDKSHKDPKVIDLNEPRHAQYLHNIKTQFFGSTSILLLRKDWNSVRLDRMHSSFKKHVQLIVFQKLLGWQLEKSETKNVYMSPRPPPKISLKHEWKRELGSDHAQRFEVGQLSRSFQSNQPILNPNRERTGETRC